MIDEILEKMMDFGLPALWQKNIGRTLSIVFILLGLTLNWHWVDMSCATGYSSFAKAMMTNAEPDSIIIAPWSAAVVLEYYQQVEGERLDLTIINRSRRFSSLYYALWLQGFSRDEIYYQIDQEDLSFVRELISQQTLYTTEYDPVWAQKFLYLPESNYFQLALPRGDS